MDYFKKERVYFTGCLKQDCKDEDNVKNKVNWYDGTIKYFDISSFVFILDFDENIYVKYKYLVDNNELEYLSLTAIIRNET